MNTRLRKPVTINEELAAKVKNQIAAINVETIKTKANGETVVTKTVPIYIFYPKDGTVLVFRDDKKELLRGYFDKSEGLKHGIPTKNDKLDLSFVTVLVDISTNTHMINTELALGWIIPILKVYSKVKMVAENIVTAKIQHATIDTWIESIEECKYSEEQLKLVLSKLKSVISFDKDEIAKLDKLVKPETKKQDVVNETTNNGKVKTTSNGKVKTTTK